MKFVSGKCQATLPRFGLICSGLAVYKLHSLWCDKMQIYCQYRLSSPGAVLRAGQGASLPPPQLIGLASNWPGMHSPNQFRLKYLLLLHYLSALQPTRKCQISSRLSY